MAFSRTLSRIALSCSLSVMNSRTTAPERMMMMRLRAVTPTATCHLVLRLTGPRVGIA